MNLKYRQVKLRYGHKSELESESFSLVKLRHLKTKGHETKKQIKTESKATQGES